MTTLRIIRCILVLRVEVDVELAVDPITLML